MNITLPRKALEANRIRGTHQAAPDVNMRVSSRRMPWASPWLKAQADVCELIAKDVSSEQGRGSEERNGWVADLSQSVNRSGVHTNGAIGTVTTSCLLYNYGKEGSPTKEDWLRCLGFDPSDVDCQSLTLSELRDLAGNGMRSQALVKIFLPVLISMKYFGARAVSST